MTNAILRGKPDAGNPHVRFDEGEVASYPPTAGRPEGVATRGAKPRRGSLLYKISMIAGVAAVFARAAVAGEESFFPFVISYDARDNAANVSRFLSAPAGRDGFVRVEGDAFVNDAGPVRFHATNLTGPANFPAHADADALAARLARLGVNCVRLHFMDTWYVNFMPKPMQGILADDSVTQRKLDPAQLDKMDYLIAALKRRGVYVDLNLHVGRTLDKRDGLPDGGPWANKCVGQFMPRMIELQKEYARDLLTHVNAYTGNAYVDEPAVAMIEISNEDSLLRPWLDGSFFGYPDPFCLELARQWNAWLRRTYGSKEAVAAAWTGPVEPLGEDLVRPGWRTEKGPADVSFALTGGVCRATVTKRGDEYHPKAFRTFPLRKGRPYTLEFKIRRLRGKGPVSFAVASTANGWTCLGLQELVNPVRDWLIVNRSFVATADCGDAFVQFTRLPAGVTDIRDVTLRPGALPPDVDPAEGFASGEVPLATRFDSAAVRRDFLRFLRDTELAYWTGLRSYVKDGLKAHAPVSGTQLDYSPQVVQGRLDYIDQHSYWRHPSGGWISLQAKEPWTIGADSMVNSLANMLYLSGCRVVGKPYTISEYNHPYPNPFGAEGQPMLAAFAAFQGWSGVFQYGYNHYVDRWAPDANPWCFFDSIARTDVLAHFPACSAMVLRGDVARARGLRAPSVTSEDTLLVQLGGSVATDYARAGGGSAADAVLHAVGVSLGAPVDRRVTPAATGGKTLVSDTGELVWNREKLGKAYFAVKAPQVKLFTGFPEGRTVDLGGVRLSVGRTSLDWATVSLVSRDATGFGEKGAASILLAATAGCGNAGRVVKRLPGGMWTLPDRGHGPVMAEGVPLTLTLPAKADTVACWALDGRGERKAEVPVKADADGRATVAVGPEFRTVWYELAVR